MSSDAEIRETDPVLARENDPEYRANGRKALRAAIGGFFVDMYDVYLPVIALAPAIAYFIPDQASKTQAATLTALIFAVSLVGRPIGSIIFGVLGDRVGRRRDVVLGCSLIPGVGRGSCVRRPLVDRAQYFHQPTDLASYAGVTADLAGLGGPEHRRTDQRAEHLAMMPTRRLRVVHQPAAVPTDAEEPVVRVDQRQPLIELGHERRPSVAAPDDMPCGDHPVNDRSEPCGFGNQPERSVHKQTIC